MALLLKHGIPHRQYFIDDEYFWLKMRGHGERQPDRHPRGIALDWRVYEAFDT